MKDKHLREEYKTLIKILKEKEIISKENICEECGKIIFESELEKRPVCSECWTVICNRVAMRSSELKRQGVL